uniref:PD-(D/E)XK endonuclease-like domain-containing protein n=1 Tax=viral metagenome TaxID=1070528 RepID=A0A6M3XZE9_9ZZZZ
MNQTKAKWHPPTDAELQAAGPPNEWDNSLRIESALCKLRYYWTLRGFTWETKPPYFSWGTAWHETLRVWHNSGVSFRQSTPAERQSAALDAIVAGLRFWQASGAVEDSVHNGERLRELFTRYINAYVREPWELVPGGDEAGWIWPLAGTPYFLGGMVDGYIRWDAYGFGILENKSEGGYLTKNFCESWQYSTQITQYAWYIEQLHPGETFGVLVNAATKQLYKSTWTTKQFERMLEQRSAIEFDRFIEDLLFDIALVELCWDRWHFPTTCQKDICTGRPGISACPFRQPCKAVREGADFRRLDLTTFLGIGLRKEPWEPWLREPTKLKTEGGKK